MTQIWDYRYCHQLGPTAEWAEAITDITISQTALQALAMRDPLTTLYNRRHFIELANQEITRSACFSYPVTLLLIDIDHFKAVNTTYGHLAGDTVLRDIALQIKQNLRQSDILARYGGTTFIVLMPQTNQSQAWIGAERLRQVIANPFCNGSTQLLVTASIGLSCWPASPASTTLRSRPHLQELISRADQALYRSKQSGRNQTQAEAWFPLVHGTISE
ncbi:GGDEF domain-containing protein [Nodosilinea sp. E11]|uniref:GGDEF domain-containing protein n=1 Tax=Nodosilinea sp. E11 TaxID=3037479 RepID=UPI0029348021|nr:GGDEF domain-containing protein [Nodosilinea sp. E11]WOD41822.1 GGDEF domain-containing protein [Nodosilinea sp. E11]